MSRFGFVTPNDPPRAPRTPQNHAKTSRGTLPDPEKCPRKIAKAAGSFFQNWKARSHIKRIPNKRGYKREAAERCSNPFDSESLPSSASQGSALRRLLIFRYRWVTQKLQLGLYRNFFGKLTYPEKVPFRYSTQRINFRCRTLPRIFMSVWNSHSRLLPDSCISHVIVRTPDFSMVSEKYSTHISWQFSQKCF